MVIFSLFYWWYTTGWLILIKKTGENLKSVFRFFSVVELAGSLFAPFRQISAGRVQGSLATQFRAWADRTFSRVMGAIFRIILILAGIITAIITAVIGVTAIFAWPFVPFAPLIVMIFIPGVTS